MRPTNFRVGNTIYWTLMTYDANGVRVDADSTPTVTVRKNGASVGDVVTVTKRAITTGIYDCSYNPAGEQEGDLFEIEETAVISAVTYDQTWSIECQAIAFDNTSDPVDVGQISGDGVSSDNLRDMFNGLGYIDPNGPSYQAQLSQIAVTGSAINASYEVWQNNTGNVVSGTPDDTRARDGVYYQIEDVGGNLDVEIEFSIGTDGVPTGFTFLGYLTSGNDDVEIQAFNWATLQYDKVGDVEGRNSASVRELNVPLFTSNVGTGVSEGVVLIKLSGTGLSSADLYIDQVYCSYAVVNRSVGYALGAVWNDDSGSNAGTTPFIDGTADNRTNSYANSIAVANAVNLFNYEWTKDDAVTLTQDHDKDTFKGFKYLVNMNGFKAPTTTEGAICFGSDASTETHFFSRCALGDLQNGNGSLLLSSDIIATECVVEDLELPATAQASGVNVQMSGCVGLETGAFAGQGYIDFGDLAGTNHRVIASDWGGTIEIRNMRAGDFLTVSGSGAVTLASSCTGGTFIPAGVINIIDNSSTVLIIRSGLVTKDEIADAVWDEDLAGHVTLGSAGIALAATELVATRLGSALEADGSGGWQYTTLALENAPSGGGGLTVQQIVDGVWDEPQSAHLNAGTFGVYLNSDISAIRTVVDDTANDIIDIENTLSSTGVVLTPAQKSELVDLVWDESLSSHIGAGSAGLYLLDSGIVSVKLDSALEADGSGGWQYTTLSLENAPSGSGGSGLYQATVRVQDSNTNALQGARVNVDGTTLTLTTDSSGEVAFNLDSGVYLLEVSPPAGYDTPVGQVLTITASDPTDTVFTLTATSPPTGCTPPWIG